MKRTAIIYDFDLTLTEEYQQFPIFRKFAKELEQKYGFSHPEEYFPRLCSGKGIEIGVGAMQQVIIDARDIFKGLTNEALRKEYGPKIALAPGLPQWFARSSEHARNKSLDLEHHVVSAGFTPLIEGTTIAPYLSSIRSGTFIDNEEGIQQIKSIVDPNNKREEIIKICKGEDVHTNLSIDKYHVNYDHVIVVGDGHSDKRKFNFISERGGIAIGVYTAGDQASRERAQKELSGRVHYLVPRDYCEHGALESVLYAALGHIAQRTCVFDYRMVHALKIGHHRAPELMKVTQNHFQHCSDCQWRSKGTTVI